LSFPSPSPLWRDENNIGVQRAKNPPKAKTCLHCGAKLQFPIKTENLLLSEGWGKEPDFID